MTQVDPVAARRFATRIVQRLREAGFEALWAGGCVRDQLLGFQPKDYDVATNATPDCIQAIFGPRRTLAIGAAFGVVAVVGRRSEGQVEVATFRQDAAYSDGRHPDHVTFSTAEQDALRRDFTINGLFYDPLDQQVIDYVGGQVDLRRRLVRAIRDPRQRIAEDKLRMLRGVRFAATFEFSLDPSTLEAIQEQAERIVIVSAERIAQEMRRMLADPHAATAVQLLQQSQLLGFVLPESQRLEPVDDPQSAGPESPWWRTLRVLGRLGRSDFSMALAALLRETVRSQQPAAELVRSVGTRWRLSKEEIGTTTWLLENEAVIRHATDYPWPQLQRVLIDPRIEQLMALAAAISYEADGRREGLDYCRKKLRLSPQHLNPPPLLTGHDLQAAGLQPGPAFRIVLEEVRDRQLQGTINSFEEALAYCRHRYNETDLR